MVDEIKNEREENGMLDFAILEEMTSSRWFDLTDYKLLYTIESTKSANIQTLM
jgi:hypothetical protein